VLRWKGGAITELSVAIKRKPPKIRADEDTIDLLRRLAVHYPDAKIAGILNRQGRHTARQLSFTASRGFPAARSLGGRVRPRRRPFGSASCTSSNASIWAIDSSSWVDARNSGSVRSVLG
jgi:hypothetical protein